MAKSILTPYKARKGVTTGKAVDHKTKGGGESDVERDDSIEVIGEDVETEGDGEGEGGEGEAKGEAEGEGDGEGEEGSPIFAQAQAESEEEEEQKPKKVVFEVDGVLLTQSNRAMSVPNYNFINALPAFDDCEIELYAWSEKGTKYTQEQVDKLGLNRVLEVIPKKIGQDIDLSFDSKDINLAKLNIKI